jgi:hypothetical protein
LSSTQKAGKARPVPHLRAPRRWLRHIERRAATQRSFQQRTTSMSLATHGLRAAVGFPPRVMRRAGGNTPRRALAVRAEITRIPAPDGSLERQGGDVQDARAVRRGGGEDRHHARRRRRFPPRASAGTRASKIPARASRRHARPCLYRHPKPETSHSARKPKGRRRRENIAKVARPTRADAARGAGRVAPSAA